MRTRIFLTLAMAALGVACSKPKTDAAPAPEPSASVEAPPAETSPVEAPPPSPPKFDASAAPAGLYKSDPGHSYLSFSYNHMGYSNPIARWGAWSAELNWDPAAPELSTVTATVDVASVDTGVEKLDEHLKAADFFDAAANPTITFKSTGLALNGGAAATMTGDLTIKGVTKPVTLDVTINKAADDSFAKAYKLGFSATGVLNRSDFGVDLYVPMVSDQVSVKIETEFEMPKGETAAQ